MKCLPHLFKLFLNLCRSYLYTRVTWSTSYDSKWLSVCKLLSIWRLISHSKIHEKPCFILFDWQFLRARKILLFILKAQSATPEQKNHTRHNNIFKHAMSNGNVWFSYGDMSWFYPLRKRLIWYWIQIACRLIFCYDKMYTIISFWLITE